MIARYSRPAMSRIWSEEGKLERWLEVELAALDAWAEVGIVPADAAREIRAAARAPSPARVAELEEKTQHDLAAFVDAVADGLGPRAAGSTTGSRPPMSSTPRSPCRSARPVS